MSPHLLTPSTEGSRTLNSPECSVSHVIMARTDYTVWSLRTLPWSNEESFRAAAEDIRRARQEGRSIGENIFSI